MLTTRFWFKITTPSDRWKGLDTHSEIAALDFAYHSVMTTILHLIQLTPGQTLTAKDLYLDSARQELSALVSICLSANKQSTVAFLHWLVTSLYTTLRRDTNNFQDPPLLPLDSSLRAILQCSSHIPHRRFQPSEDSRRLPDPERNSQRAHRQSAETLPGVCLALSTLPQRRKLYRTCRPDQSLAAGDLLSRCNARL